MKVKIFNDVSSIDIEKELKENIFPVFKSNWDDYGNKVTYEICLSKNRYYNIKIFDKEEFKNNEVIDVNLQSNCNFSFSIPTELAFYKELKYFFDTKDKQIEFLKDIKDIGFISVNFKDIDIDDFNFQNSILRDNDSKIIFSIAFFKYKKVIEENYFDFVTESYSSIYYMILEKLISCVENDVVSDENEARVYRYILSFLAQHVSNREVFEKMVTPIVDKLGHTSVLNADDGNSERKIKELCEDIKEELKLKNSDNNPDQTNYQNIFQCSLGHYTALENLIYFLPINENNIHCETNMFDNEKSNFDNCKKENNLFNAEEYHTSPLRLSNIKQQNDPLEGKALLEYLGIDQKCKRTVRDKQSNRLVPVDEHYEEVYISCLTDRIDDLMMWNSYGNYSQGICLIYSAEYISKIIESDYFNIYRVSYIDIENNKGDIEIIEKLNKLKDEIRNSTLNEDRIINILGDLRYLFKYSDFRSESEYRIICRLDEIIDKDTSEYTIRDVVLKKKQGAPIPFLYLYAKEPVIYDSIMLGPKMIDLDYVIPYIAHFNNLSKNNIIIEKSRISFR